ncbi:hypothetical protein DSECCO2_607050 [anaerobic digester metagenome]
MSQVFERRDSAKEGSPIGRGPEERPVKTGERLLVPAKVHECVSPVLLRCRIPGVGRKKDIKRLRRLCIP